MSDEKLSAAVWKPSGGPRPSDEQFRILVESIQDYAIFMLDPEGRVTSWNAGARRLKGYTFEEIVGRSFEVFYPADVVARGWPREELDLAAADGRFEDAGWRIRKDGTHFWAHVVITALRDADGSLRGFAKVTRDMSQQRQQEDELRGHAEQLRLLVDSVSDYAIFLVDPRGRILTWNSGAAAINGYAAEEVIDRDFSLFFTADDVAAGVPQRELATALRDGRAEAEGWRVRKDGSTFWVNAIISPVFDRNGVLRGYAKVTRDLTDSRRLLALEQSSRRLKEFLAILGHELRNPLAPIRNAVSVMQLQPGYPHEFVAARDVIDRQLTHLTRLVDDLLDLGRLVNGKVHLKLGPVDYRALVLTSVEALRPQFAARSQRLEVDVAPGPVMVVGDEVRLAQSLQNLLQNAMRYTPESGEIRVALLVEETQVVTVITDTGRGIAPEGLERIFKLFSQEDAQETGGAGGLGIGLSLARTLVEQHGGSLAAHSEGLGQGSTFTVRLPRRYVAPPGAADSSADDEPAVAFQRRRILVVDDNHDSADTMAQTLELLGHEARSAYGAEHALREAEIFRPQIVLLDLNMPDGDGFSVMERLRWRVPGPLFVAAVTGYGLAHNRQRTREAGFKAHLTKPVSAQQLDELLRIAIPVTRGD